MKWLVLLSLLGCAVNDNLRPVPSTLGDADQVTDEYQPGDDAPFIYPDHAYIYADPDFLPFFCDAESEAGCYPKVVSIHNHTNSTILVISETLVESGFAQGCFTYERLFNKEDPIPPNGHVDYRVSFTISTVSCTAFLAVSTTFDSVVVPIDGKYFLW